ncbi:MAG TPA: MBL fold metallo-hydrolase [Anaerolineae bacterium]|nr:MBL fold metallo-hydrolase [Anaerolineae bacterium]
MQITCLVDNSVEPGTRLWGEHGLSFLIESHGDRLLFDTGASGSVLLHNMQTLHVDPQTISALAISHAHWDHTGGLPFLLGLRPGLPLYANADLLRERFSRRGGAVKSIGMPIPPTELRQQADLRLSADCQEILPGMWTTGEVGGRLYPEGRSAHHLVRQGETWAPDPYRDDMALVLESSCGLVLVCGCCQAGLLNTLDRVQQAFGLSVHAVIGGAHLVGADADHLRHLMTRLDGLGMPNLYLNHCTGLAAYLSLAVAFGDRVHPCPAGTVLEY